MKLDITKKVDLTYLGESWKDCYLEFRLPSISEIKGFTDVKVEEGKEAEMLDTAMARVAGLFVSGKARSDGKIAEVSKDDLKDFPVEVITKCFKAISGELDPK